jgi:hypothetical protein
MGLAAGHESWLPGRDGTFRRPAELSLDDLPPTYTRDEGLAHALGMMQPVVAEAARQLGVPAAVLWGLSGRPDLVALVERELGQDELQKGHPARNHAAASAAFGPAQLVGGHIAGHPHLWESGGGARYGRPKPSRQLRCIS